MAYNQYSCAVEDFANTGFDKCNRSLGAIAMIILTTDDFHIDTEAQALTYAAWETGIQARTVFPLPKVWSFTDQSEKDAYETSPLGWKKLGKEGLYGGEFLLDAPLGMQIALRSFNGADLRVFYVDINGNILGMSTLGVILQGYKVGLFNCEGMSSVTAAGETRKIVVHLDESTPKDRDDYGVVVYPTAFNPLELEGLKDVDLTVVTASATHIVFDAKTHLGQVGVTGLIFTDVTAPTGASSMAAHATIAGRYDITGTGMATGTLDLIGPATLGVKGIMSSGVITVTVPTP